MPREPGPAPTLCPLGRYTLIAADGDDAVDFLQGQLSLDVDAVTQTQSRLGALLNAKGRALALVRALRCDNRLMLMLPVELAAAVRSHLSRYVMRAKVTLSEVGDDYRAYGITPGGNEPLPPYPRAVDEAMQLDDGCLVRTRSAGRARLLGIFRSDRSGNLGGFADAASVTPKAWYLDDIYAGQPEIFEPTRERFIPQMINLDLLGGVSFDKGCYVGQEIVARTQNLGRIKRRMVGFRCGRAAAPTPGTAIVAAESPPGAAAGHVVRAAPEPGGGCALLAVMSLAELGRAFVLADSDSRLEPFAVPYAIPELTGAG